MLFASSIFKTSKGESSSSQAAISLVLYNSQENPPLVITYMMRSRPPAKSVLESLF